MLLSLNYNSDESYLHVNNIGSCIFKANDNTGDSEKSLVLTFVKQMQNFALKFKWQ